MNGEVQLNFTQSDRDLLMSMDAKLDNMTSRADDQHRRLNRHHRRICSLESLRDRGQGAAWAVKMLWVAVAFVAGLFGWHLTKHP